MSDSDNINKLIFSSNKNHRKLGFELMEIHQPELYKSWLITLESPFGFDFDERPIYDVPTLDILYMTKKPLAHELVVFSLMRNVNDILVDGVTLDELPKEMEDMPKLETLNLHNTIVYNFPTWLKDTNIKTFKMHSCGLKKIPMEVFDLTSVECLSLNDNHFDHIPKEITKMTNLRHLSLDGCDMTTVPGYVTDMPSLRSLSMNGYMYLMKVDHHYNELFLKNDR